MENKCLKQDLKKAMDLNSQTLNLSKGMPLLLANDLLKLVVVFIDSLVYNQYKLNKMPSVM